MSNIVSIIGTRSPNEEQINSIINWLTINKNRIDLVISGCADGADSIALKTAFGLGIKTLGIIPWKKHGNQEFCTVVMNLENLKKKDRVLYDEAMASVDVYHPAPHHLTHGARMLHARNYLIIKYCTELLAYPLKMSGGTMQGVRIAEGLCKNGQNKLILLMDSADSSLTPYIFQ